MKNKKRWIPLLVVMLLFGGCFGDRMIASVIFHHHCSNSAGLFIYEKVELGDEYFLPRPVEGTIESRKLDRSTIYDEELVFNEEKIRDKYQYIYSTSEKLSAIGPVYKIKSSVVRLEDKLTLAEAISISNSTGWLANFGPFPPVVSTCPNGMDSEERPLYTKDHSDLLTLVFTKK